MSEACFGICKNCPALNGLEYGIESDAAEIIRIQNMAMESRIEGTTYEFIYEAIEGRDTLIADLQNPGRWVNVESLEELTKILRSNAAFNIEEKEKSMEDKKQRLQNMLGSCSLGPLDISVNVLGTKIATFCRSSLPDLKTPNQEPS